MQRDRFRSLTHCWDEYRRRRREDAACLERKKNVWDEAKDGEKEERPRRVKGRNVSSPAGADEINMARF